MDPAFPYEAIGFRFRSDEELQDALGDLFRAGMKVLECEGGSYLQWKSDSGAEMWFHAGHDRRIVGVTPHFHGTARMTVELKSRIQGPQHHSLVGCYSGWANLDKDFGQSSRFPIVFDCPGFGLYKDLTLPLKRLVHISAFALEIYSVHESEPAYYQALKGSIGYSAKSFIPVGTITGDGAPAEVPLPIAEVTGIVQKTDRRVNSATQCEFIWARVKTLGGCVDMVVPAGLIAKPLSLHVGTVIQGRFWLSGRILESPIHLSSHHSGATIAPTEENQGAVNKKLLRACRRGKVKDVLSSLEDGADIETRNSAGSTPLILAAKSGHWAIVALLLERGADIEAKDNRGSTALFRALRNKRIPIVRLLIERHANIDQSNPKGRERFDIALNKALMASCREGRMHDIQWLIELGAYANYSVGKEKTPGCCKVSV
ncbi:ankyrin repeat domain-containing protein [Thermodesulfobacteriota bacterium]